MNSNIYNNLSRFFKNRTIEVVGFLLIIAAITLFISFFSYSPNDPSFIYNSENVDIKNYLGLYGGIVSDFLLQSFGITSFLILITLISWGINLVVKKKITLFFLRIFCLVIYLCLSCLFVYSKFNNSFWLIDNGNSGFVGQLLFNYINNFSPLIENQYVSFLSIVLIIVFFTIASEINFRRIFIDLRNFIKKISGRSNQISKTESTNNEIIENEMSNNMTYKDNDQQSFSFEKSTKISTERSKNINLKNFKLPSLDLLEKNSAKTKDVIQNKNQPDAGFIEKILLDFGIDGKIKTINNGPVVSLYEFEPAPGVKVSKIINLSEDLARNTSSTSARVSVIPGKNTVGIEIPNEAREGVSLREIISNDKFQKKEVRLPIALGKSISGAPIVGDLTNMPHLLIAGTTGSGKSVCINTIIVSLLYKLNPDLCKFILIDPKMLELSTYEGIPHLLTPVITDAKKATSALAWMCAM